MANVYFGFAIADSMFEDDAIITKRKIDVVEAKEIIAQGIIPCLNPSHVATIDAMRRRFDIDVEIPATPPQVKLYRKDRVIVMGVRGLPRMTDRHEYIEEEIAAATFSFSLYTIVE